MIEESLSPDLVAPTITFHEIDALERQLMESLGLPSSFSTTKRPAKSQSDKRHAKVKKRLSKYWHQRYRLFSRFDEGIQLDKESWYSVTPEMIAHHIASRCLNKGSTKVILDPFCGVGGNVIQFALSSEDILVIASDIDPKKVRMAQHNASIYGVSDRIAFLVGDFFQIIRTIKIPIDCIFLSPPWGGPDYLNREVYSLSNMQPNGFDIYKAAKENVTSNVALLLPRNIDRDELNSILGPNECVEIEENLINDKPKTLTAYFGQLVISKSD